ncbi:uncharacterized protein UTRI_01785_B [Ustilago trichophora]|uniref:PIN domain-containing protein n=1 Tax=Ustilago trichophora TaxID=86804 RepID=A0A5C3E402_9BASI|nr:uncharacterized protein UTRI_01785_B [Ustilago trichophora]
MSDETIQQKAERQARLSHAMGVMFLQDKVDKLERDVTKITYPRSMHKSKSGPAADLSSSNPRRDVSQGRPIPRALSGPGVASTADAPADRSFNSTATTAGSIRLVDASVLIFSLRSVHNWSRDQSSCVIIPLEAINTLDLLKKGDEPINLAARKATRWLEDKIAVSTQDGDLMLTQPAPGIFAQREHFRAATAQIEKARAAALAHESSSEHATELEVTCAAASTSSAKDMFSAVEAPRYLRELLSVCLYCHQAASTASNYAVAIAYPPAHLQEKMIEAQLAANDKPSYLNRTDGRATEAWLDAYRIPFEVVPTSKTWTGEKPSSRFRGEIAGSHNVGSSDDLLGSKQEYGSQQRRKGSPTPSISSSTGSFRSELSGLSMLSSHKSPRHRHDARFTNTAAPLRSVRCMSTCTATSATTDDTESRDDGSDDEGPIIARPSSAASSHTSFVSSLTTSTQDDWSSQTSASFSSHCGTRITRHAPSPAPPTATMTSAIDHQGPMSTTACEPGASSTATATPSSSCVPRLTSRTLHKTKSGAEKMEEYLRRLDAGAASGTTGGGGAADRRTAATPTPGNRHS